MCVSVCRGGGGGGGRGEARRAADSSCWFEFHIVSLDKKLYSPLSLAPHVCKTGTRIKFKRSVSATKCRIISAPSHGQFRPS